MSDDLLPCPFCGGEAQISTRTDECLWSHNQVEWTAISCSGKPDFDCFQPSVDWPSSATDEAGTQLSVSQWNRRALPAFTLPDDAAKVVEEAGRLEPEIRKLAWSWAHETADTIRALIAIITAQAAQIAEALAAASRADEAAKADYAARVAAETALAAEREKNAKLVEALQKTHDALLWCARDGRMASPSLHQYPAKWAAEAGATLANTEAGAPSKSSTEQEER